MPATPGTQQDPQQQQGMSERAGMKAAAVTQATAVMPASSNSKDDNITACIFDIPVHGLRYPDPLRVVGSGQHLLDAQPCAGRG
jgi:hypothetical protein